MVPNSYPPSTQKSLPNVYLEAGRTPRPRRPAPTHSCQTAAGNSAMAGEVMAHAKAETLPPHSQPTWCTPT